MENTNEKPTPAQRLENLAERIGADVHRLVDEFEAFVEKEIAKAHGEAVEDPDKTTGDAPGAAGTGTAAGADAPGAAGTGTAEGAGAPGAAGTTGNGTEGQTAGAADPNGAGGAETPQQAPTDGEKTAG
jgi:hypothetical protein